MLNEEKIILMTKLAIYEKGEGKKEIPMSRYYRNDYVGVHMLYTFLAVTVGYVLLFALYIARDVEEFLSSLTTMDLRKFLFTAVGIYVGAVLFFLFISWVIFRRRFKKNREHLNEYYGNLKKLRRLQKKEEAAALKIVEGKESEEKETSKEEAEGASGQSAEEEPDEEDIFRESKEKRRFRGWNRPSAAEAPNRKSRKKNGEDPGTVSGEEEEEDLNKADWEEDLNGADWEEDLNEADWEEDLNAADREEDGEDLSAEVGKNIINDLNLHGLGESAEPVDDLKDEEEDEDGFTFSS